MERPMGYDRLVLCNPVHTLLLATDARAVTIRTGGIHVGRKFTCHSAGSWLPKFGIRVGSGIVASIVVATIGALILLIVLGLISRQGRRRW